MTEWWSYGLSDFLLFSPRTYFRLFELHNKALWKALWPAQLPLAALGLLVLSLLACRKPGLDRSLPIALALLWAWVGWAFFRQRYATINWAAGHVAAAFALEALLLLAAGLGGWLRFTLRRDARSLAGAALFLEALLLHPLLAPLAGRPWAAAEIFGIAPDPTAIGTSGLLLLAGGKARLALLPVPLSWCVLSWVTLLAMGEPQAWLMLAAPIATLLLVAHERRATRH